jgi:hypothetical protein
LRGFVIGIIQYDVSEEIRLEDLLVLPEARRKEVSFKHATPEYVRFANPPVIESLGPTLCGDWTLHTQIKYYDYGVISVLFELPFSGDWKSLVELSGKWVPNHELERTAEEIVRERIKQIAPALVRIYQQWLSEDYYVFMLTEIAGQPRATDLLAEHGAQIAQIVRGESIELAQSEQEDVIRASLSYYPQDLTVIGWNASFICDNPNGARTSVQILEYVNSQLLEFRYYDELLTRELSLVYASLKARAGSLRRWRMRQQASRLNTVTVEVTELMERADTAIKFVSDMFSARLYRLAANKVGVHEYKNLVTEKLATAAELYRFMIEQFNQSRGFLLELMVVIILVIELIYLFQAKG